MGGDWNAYKFTYDKLNRLEKGEYTRKNAGTTSYGTNNGFYNEIFTYDNDKMGNIKTLTRYHGNATTKVDDLTLTYNGNKVTQINEPGTSFGYPSGTIYYSYNNRGNLSGLTTSTYTQFTYNHLGLLISMKNGTTGADNLKYTYDGIGRKITKQLDNGVKRYYIDGVEYVGANMKFVHTPYGRIIKDGSKWLYSYFLKDHLGSVRVVFDVQNSSSSSSSATYLATMEESRVEEENRYFENVDATRADLPYNYPNRNPANTKVSKVPGKSEGLKLTLQVMAGDTIEISAKAFYNMDKTYPAKSVNVAPIVGGILAGMTNPVSTVVGETTQLTNNLGTLASNSTVLSNLPEENNQNNAPQPKSGINFVLYNSSFDVVEENTGYLPVDDHINAIQNLATDKLVMKEAGFLEIFVNNEAQTPVYYDNLMVTMAWGTAIETYAYYPSGMLIPHLSASLAMVTADNYYKFSAKEIQTELGLNWYDFGARMYDPTVGRWWTPDPMAEKHYNISPYAYCANNPIRYIDPDGLDWYEDEDRNVIWVNCEAKNYTYKKSEYKNIGKEYQGLTVKVYDKAEYESSFGIEPLSTEIKLSYKGQEGEEYQWVQTIETNYLGKRQTESPYIDTDPKFNNAPFYNEKSEYGETTFSDTPYRSGGSDTYWNAELSVVKNMGSIDNYLGQRPFNGRSLPDTYARVLTVSHGFHAENRKTAIRLLRIVNNPSTFHINSINNRSGRK